MVCFAAFLRLFFPSAIRFGGGMIRTRQANTVTVYIIVPQTRRGYARKCGHGFAVNGRFPTIRSELTEETWLTNIACCIWQYILVDYHL